MVSYANGALPDSLLGAVADGRNVTDGGDGERLPVGAVRQMQLFGMAFRKRFGKALYVASGYRTLAMQRQKWNERQAYLNGTGPYAPLAAKVGTSNHGGELGAADLWSRVDVKGSEEHKWAVANAPRFGLRWPKEWAEGAGEWWHFDVVRHLTRDEIKKLEGELMEYLDWSQPSKQAFWDDFWGGGVRQVKPSPVAGDNGKATTFGNLVQYVAARLSQMPVNPTDAVMVNRNGHTVPVRAVLNAIESFAATSQIQLTPEQVGQLADALGTELEGGAVTAADLDAVKDEILAAISGVDEATLRAFGLQRISAGSAGAVAGDKAV